MLGHGIKVVGYNVDVVAASISMNAEQITTMKVILPSVVSSELDNCRMLSLSWASDGHIPVEEQLEQVERAPFVPMHVEQNQVDVEISKDHAHEIHQWITARDSILEQVRSLLALGIYNEWAVSRLLNAFTWQAVLITATEWDEFFALQADPSMHPEFRIIVEMMQEAYKAAVPQFVREGEWHLPFIQADERDGNFEHSDTARRVSAARCARLSHLGPDGRRDTKADLALFELLVKERRLSPLGHVATPFTKIERQVRDRLGNIAISDALDAQFAPREIHRLVEITDFSGNFRGWTELRMMPDKYAFGQAGRS